MSETKLTKDAYMEENEAETYDTLFNSEVVQKLWIIWMLIKNGTKY